MLATSPSASASWHFNPRPSYEGRLMSVLMSLLATLFQSTPLIRGATERLVVARAVVRISIHAPHTRGDRPWARYHFNPRPSYEGRRAPGSSTRRPPRDFNPRPSYEGRPRTTTPRARRGNFNPRPSYEGRLTASPESMPAWGFQSTPLIRGATWTATTTGPRSRNFNPRPSYEERPPPPPRSWCRSHFNPRPSYEGRRGWTCSGRP